MRLLHLQHGRLTTVASTIASIQVGVKKYALVDSSRVFHFMDFGFNGRVLDRSVGVGSVRDLGSLSCSQTRCSKKRNTTNLEPSCPYGFHSAERVSAAIVNPGLKSAQPRRGVLAGLLMHRMQLAMSAIHFPIRPAKPYSRFWSRSPVVRRRLAIVIGTTSAAESLASCLTRCGVESRIASSAAEAIERSFELKPDLIVSDVILCDMSAIDAGCQIRNLLPDCAVLFYSGALLNRMLDDSESQIAIGKALLQVAATATRSQGMYLIRT